MDIESLKNKRQLNVQEQNALEKHYIMSAAKYWRENPIPAALKKFFIEKGIDLEKSIILDYSQNSPGCSTDFGTILTSEGKFFKFDMDLKKNKKKIIEIYEWQDITDKINLDKCRKRLLKEIKVKNNNHITFERKLTRTEMAYKVSSFCASQFRSTSHSMMKYFIFTIISLVVGCASTQPLMFRDFKLDNVSEKKVYGYYQFGDVKGSVGVLSPGHGATKGFAPFEISQKAKIYFMCDLDDVSPCATGQIDVSKFYPKGDYKHITTVFTFIENNKINLSFNVTGFDGKGKSINIGLLEN